MLAADGLFSPSCIHKWGIWVCTELAHNYTPTPGDTGLLPQPPDSPPQHWVPRRLYGCSVWTDKTRCLSKKRCSHARKSSKLTVSTEPQRAEQRFTWPAARSLSDLTFNESKYTHGSLIWHQAATRHILPLGATASKPCSSTEPNRDSSLCLRSSSTRKLCRATRDVHHPQSA